MIIKKHQQKWILGLLLVALGFGIAIGQGK